MMRIIFTTPMKLLKMQLKNTKITFSKILGYLLYFSKNLSKGIQKAYD